MALRDLPFTIIYVDDVEKAKTYYRDVLGLEPAFVAPGWVQFDTHGAALVLHSRASNQEAVRGGLTHAAFRVDDLDAEYRRLTERAVKFVAPPASAGMYKQATLVDPDGNEIDLLEWKPSPVIRVTEQTTVNDIINQHPETMEVFEEHGIRICGGCLVLLNAPVYETAEYSGLGYAESSKLVEELNAALNAV